MSKRCCVSPSCMWESQSSKRGGGGGGGEARGGDSLLKRRLLAQRNNVRQLVFQVLPPGPEACHHRDETKNKPPLFSPPHLSTPCCIPATTGTPLFFFFLQLTGLQNVQNCQKTRNEMQQKNIHLRQVFYTQPGNESYLTPDEL